MALQQRSVRRAIRIYEGQHPRLQASIAPLSPDPESNVLPYVTAEFLAQGKTLHLRGKALEKYVADKVAEARLGIRGAGAKEK